MVVIHVCLYVCGHGRQGKGNGNHKGLQARQLDALFLRLLEHCSDSVTLSLFSASEEVFALVTTQSKPDD